MRTDAVIVTLAALELHPMAALARTCEYADHRSADSAFLRYHVATDLSEFWQTYPSTCVKTLRKLRKRYRHGGDVHVV